MVKYIGMKMETLELCHADKQEDGTLKWRAEYAQAEHKIMDEIHKTLTLVSIYEGDFKQILQRKMGKKKPAGK
jgi:hypothetical protein